MLRYRTHDLCQLDDVALRLRAYAWCAWSRITGRTDDMLIIRGVNVFPSQIESVLVERPWRGAALHAHRRPRRARPTRWRSRWKSTEEMFSDTVGQHRNSCEKQITERIKSVVGISANIKLVAPKSIPRSEGKAKRVIDKRKL